MHFISSKLAIFNFCAQTIPRRILVDTMYVLCKAAGN